MGAEQLITSATQNGEIKLKSLVDIAGQNFIVTGAAKGIGLAISSLFNSLGAKVSGWDLDDAGMKNKKIEPIAIATGIPTNSYEVPFTRKSRYGFQDVTTSS